MAAQWPFPNLPGLLARGEQVWWGLEPQDWREALAAHPRIGDRPPAGSQESREQAGADGADARTLAAIAVGNRRYEARFAMTYVVRASGRTAEEMLALLECRLEAEPGQEIRTAAGQQWEITSLRLETMWGSSWGGTS